MAAAPPVAPEWNQNVSGYVMWQWYNENNQIYSRTTYTEDVWFFYPVLMGDGEMRWRVVVRERDGQTHVLQNPLSAEVNPLEFTLQVEQQERNEGIVGPEYDNPDEGVRASPPVPSEATEEDEPDGEENPRGFGKMLHKLMKGAGMSHLLVPEGGRSAKWGFVHRMLGENKVKNKGSYKPANSLPKGSKMNAPRHFTFSKIKGRPIVSKFIDKWFNNEGRRYLRANKFEDALKGKTTQEIKDMLHELIGNPQNKGKKNTPKEYGKTMDEIRANVVRLMREGK